MKTQFFKLSSITAGAALLLFSCTKEAPMKTYPNEISMDNWEEFVDAPKAVLNEAFANYSAQTTPQTRSIDNNSTELDAPKCPTLMFGNVKGWDGSAWVDIPDVDVTLGNQSTSTNLFGNYALCDNNSELCMSYPQATSEEGVNVIDLVVTQRHILGIELFPAAGATPEDAARMYIAADVTQDGNIDSLDIDLMIDIILVRTTFAENFDFVASARVILPFAQSVFLSWMHEVCRPSTTIEYDTYIIKRGDVNGDYGF